MKTSLNPLEVYAEAGRKAAKARNQHDESRAAFFTSWFKSAMRLETDQWRKMAKCAFDEAYKTERGF
jgi:hypothetical protein